MIDYVMKKFLIAILRRASYKWPPRNEALKTARIERGLYKCNACSNSFGRKEIKIDHIEPVVDPLKGFQTWDEYINRMFCQKEGFQILCEPCHNIKSDIEKKIRKEIKKKKLDI